MEVGRYNIRVNCISPGRTEGERIENIMRARAAATGRTYEEVLEKDIARARANAPLGKIMVAPEDIANTVVFLASDESSSITGQTILVDAGTMA